MAAATGATGLQWRLLHRGFTRRCQAAKALAHLPCSFTPLREAIPKGEIKAVAFHGTVSFFDLSDEGNPPRMNTDKHRFLLARPCSSVFIGGYKLAHRAKRLIGKRSFWRMKRNDRGPAAR